MSYTPGGTVAHALDPRSKLAVQAGFAIAAFAHTTPRGLVALTVVVLAILASARLSPLAVLRDLWFVFPFLVFAPLLEGVTLGDPWFVVGDAVFPALAGYRVVLVLLVSAAYVHTTPTRESRAAVQWLVPGRPGQVLGMGVAFVFRFVPVLVADVTRARDAMQARLGTERPRSERMSIVAISGLNRAFARADALALALRARCFAWNPTLPRLAFRRVDALALGVSLGLAATPLLAL